MIWPELWAWALVVVLRQDLIRRWINANCCDSRLDRKDKQHHGPHSRAGIYCSCPQCVAELTDIYSRWAQIR